MIIPSKHSGYVNCVRLYNGGGGGGGASASVADSGGTGSNPGFSITDGGTTGTTSGTTTTTPAVAPWGTTQQSKANYYNSQLGMGQNDAQIRASVEGNTQFGGPQSNVDWNTLIQTAAMNNPTGRPMAGSGQFYQPVYQQQYQNYNTGNPMGISQYGQQPSGGLPQMQTPFSMFGGQMMGGGYGQFGDNNPYNPFTNSFLNMPSNLNQGTMQEKADFYGGAIGQGFTDQQLYNQASGLFGQQSPKDWGYLQGTAMGMTSGLGQGTAQDKANFYNQARGQGFSDNSIRNAANQMIGQQTPQDWSYLQQLAGQGKQQQYGDQTGMMTGRGFQPDFSSMRNDPRFQDQPMSMPQQTPIDKMSFLGGTSQALQGAPQQNQPIYSRSSMRRAGPIRNYEEGGITSLLDKE
jgi:hypothetical protein